MKDNIFIHIGVPKSGTTALQTHLFVGHKELISIGKIKQYSTEGVYPNKKLEYFFSTLKKSEEITFPYDKMHEIYIHEIEKYWDKKIIISDEGFTNSILGDTYLKAKRLKHFFPEAKIIYVIRNQFDLIKSFYYMVPKSPLFLTNEKKPLSYNKWLDISFNNINNSFLLSGKYYDVYQIYTKLFSEGKILVLLYEDFKYNIEYFGDKLSEFMSIDSKESLALLKNKEKINTKEHHILKHFGAKYPFIEYLFPLFKCLGQDFFCDKIFDVNLTKENRTKIIDLYKDSNDKLNNIMNNNLFKNGYPN